MIAPAEAMAIVDVRTEEDILDISHNQCNYLKRSLFLLQLLFFQRKCEYQISMFTCL